MTLQKCGELLYQAKEEQRAIHEDNVLDISKNINTGQVVLSFYHIRNESTSYTLW